jgi:1,4-dihydroxy-2-naphthoyl-CoA hydrolase
MSALKTVSPDQLNALCERTLMNHLGIRITRITADVIEGTMPVNETTHQPFGALHGGASVVLAESLASLGANLCVDDKKFFCVGIEINANHIRSVRSGVVTGRARPLHLGSTTQVWETQITNDSGDVVCISRMTLAVRTLLTRPG